MRQHKDQLGPFVIDNVERGLKYDAEDVARAHLQQSKIARDWLALFDEVDAVIAPTCSVPPFPHENGTVTEIDGQQLDTYMSWLALTYRPTMAMACVAAIPWRGWKWAALWPTGTGSSGKRRKILNIALAMEYLPKTPIIAARCRILPADESIFMRGASLFSSTAIQAVIWMFFAVLTHHDSRTWALCCPCRYASCPIGIFRLFALVLILPFARGADAEQDCSLRAHLLRAGVGMCAMWLWFQHNFIPITDQTALSFAPIFTTLGAVIFLKEVVQSAGWRRYQAVWGGGHC